MTSRFRSFIIIPYKNLVWVEYIHISVIHLLKIIIVPDVRDKQQCEYLDIFSNLMYGGCFEMSKLVALDHFDDQVEPPVQSTNPTNHVMYECN